MRIENLLGSNQYGYVLNKLDTPGVAWYHTETTANSFDKILPYNSSFSHLMFKKDAGPISELFECAFPILLAALDQVVHAPHKDHSEPHHTGLYYLNETDGDTVVYNETEESKEYTIKERLTPKANTWHQFDGNHYHSSSAPTQNEKRITLTFNYTTIDDK